MISHSDGTYLILRRSNTDVRRPGDWDLPGGRLDPGETLDAGALREIEEEIGISPSDLLVRYSSCRIIDEAKNNLNYMQLIYSATTDTKEMTLSDEHDQYEWLSAAEMKKDLNI